MKRKSMIYAFTNTAFYSREKAAEKIRAENQGRKNNEFNLTQRRQEEERRK